MKIQDQLCAVRQVALCLICCSNCVTLNKSFNLPKALLSFSVGKVNEWYQSIYKHLRVYKIKVVVKWDLCFPLVLGNLTPFHFGKCICLPIPSKWCLELWQLFVPVVSLEEFFLLPHCTNLRALRKGRLVIARMCHGGQNIESGLGWIWGKWFFNEAVRWPTWS